MSAISRSLANPQPLYTRVLYPTKRKYQIIRMKEILHNAMNGNRSGNMFAVPADTKTSYPGSATADGFAVPSAIAPSPAPTGVGMAQPGMKSSAKRASVDAG